MKKLWYLNYAITLVVFAAISIYIVLWRGQYDVHLFNKAIASTAAIIAGIALVVRYLPHKELLGSYLDLRRTLGLTALGLVFVHLFLSLVVLQSYFPLQWLIKEKYALLVGSAAFWVWLYLAWLSRPSESDTLDWRLRMIQRWGGRISFIFIFLHVALLKYPYWIQWFKGEALKGIRPSMPPINLLVSLCMALVFVVLIYKSMRAKTAKPNQ